MSLGLLLPELQRKIMLLLPSVRDVLSLARTCKACYRASLHPHIWTSLGNTAGPYAKVQWIARRYLLHEDAAFVFVRDLFSAEAQWAVCCVME